MGLLIRTVHDGNDAIPSAFRIDVVMAQLTGGPANIATFSGNLAGDIAWMQSVGHAAETALERMYKRFCSCFCVGIALLQSKVKLERYGSVSRC